MTDQAEEQKLPQARMYWRSAKWGLESLLREKLSGTGYQFYMIGILAALRAVQHSLDAHDRNLSPKHERIISAWWKKTADDTKFDDLRFIKNARNLVLKAGSFESYSTYSESGIGEGANYKVTRSEYELAYYDDDGNRHDLEVAIQSAISWCDRELSEIELQLG